MRVRQKGFTLIELSVVLVIMGLLMGAIFGAGSTQIAQARITSTKQKQEAIKLALISFIARNNRLPCPAVSNLALGAAGYGLEAATPGTCTGATINGQVATGIVPWASLSLSDENGTDGYYNRFTYQVTLNATNTTSETIAGLKGAISTHSGTPAVLPPAAGANQTNNCTPVGGNYNPCSVVVVVMSHGADGAGAFDRDGIQKAAPAGADEIENTNNDSKFVIKDYSDAVANPFDDILLPLSAPDLLAGLTTHGTIGDYRASISEDLSNIKNSIIADAVRNRAGAPGAFIYPIAAALPALPASTTLDPWGNNYVYARNIASVSNATAGNILTYTVTSYGPDLVVGGNDDIVTQINVNVLQDAFAKAGW
ncbi:MAG TPA: prepilin-type N-terminal cleavage/methylation domain-containing protein [Methylotenera sp.]|nr:prepilin-type N-terminal cleavage/methylation domain-containing protein [Methylotenera sp.]HPH06397.1 prepilin-type N-terminal cleavage/methylation domain-containing protein [Methylotenera sp.]HPN01827.1 prepilin-type N-terminal cleavage/methylation domain-containing protein [Methylotenera sp.]